MTARTLRAVAAFAAVGALLCQTSTEARRQQRTLQTYFGTLNEARVDELPERVVVSLAAQGDLRGLITLNLTRGEGGTLSGEWALVVAYLQDLNADGSIALTAPVSEHDEHGAHREYARFVREGTVQGTVESVQFHFGPDGKPDGLEAADLLVTNGSMNFAGAKGSGRLTQSAADAPKTTFTITF